ncbi:AAA family ATPase [Nocardia sp. 348MFTsu5.1]|uniref:AAA family ATPase n=1 Tax=Nocardia sp. 348MFTsu5.1 TaxID=1172185 RepID=UPI0003748045|nr:AAA family ATPase [Nocardia sp. 348MFTsu5.1]
MKLHRLRLGNFRGIVEREIEFATVGVTVVEGANEAGKSSMIEALDLLLEVRSDSKSTRVRAVAPAGVDAGSLVEADISCGPYRFTYTKQYNRGARTELVIHEPAPEQLSGRTAHDKVSEILDGAVDMGLFKALRLMQSADPSVGDLSGSSALSRALDAGSVHSDADDTDGNSALVSKVRTEYERYFTASQGRPSRELAAAAADLEAAEVRHAEMTAVMAEIAKDSARLDSLTVSRREVANSVELAKVELAELSYEREQATSLHVHRRDAQLAVRLVDQERALLDRDLSARADLDRQIADRNSGIDDVDRAVADLRENLDDCVREADAAQVSLDDARRRDVDATEQVATARMRARLDGARSRHRELAGILDRVDQVCTELVRCRRDVAAVPYGSNEIRVAEALSDDVTVARAHSEAAAATMTVTRLGGHDVTVAGALGDNAPGDGTEFAVTGETVVDVAGVVRVVVSPGAESATLAHRVTQAQRALADFLAERGVGDVAELRALVRRRERAESAVEALRAQLAGILGDHDEEVLRAEYAELDGRVGVSDSRSEDVLDVAQAEQASNLAAAAVSRLAEEAAELRSRRRGFEGELQRLGDNAAELRRQRDELLTQRAQLNETADDADLDRRRGELVDRLAAAQQTLARIDTQIADADLESLEMQYSNKAAVVEQGQPKLNALTEEINELRTRIDIRRDDGKLEQFNRAASELDGARAEYGRVQTRANAVALLMRTLERHRDNTRRRYVAPFSEQILRLGKVVFGSSLQIGVDEELRITTRTLDGVTVDHDALSGGAKEQLGIISRLACAMLVDPVDGVPVIIDDALGYTDPGRLAGMSAVLAHAGRQTQVIVLTCTPARYSGVGGAQLVAV